MKSDKGGKELYVQRLQLTKVHNANLPCHFASKVRKWEKKNKMFTQIQRVPNKTDSSRQARVFICQSVFLPYRDLASNQAT